MVLLLSAGIFYLFFTRLNLPAPVVPKAGESCEQVPDKTLSHAVNFGVSRCGGFRVVWVKNGMAEPLRWVLRDSLSPEILPENLLAYPTLKVPAQRIAIFSSTYLGFLTALGVEDRVAVIDAKKYVANPEFYARIDSLKIKEVGEGMELSPEAVYEARPDMIFAFSMGASIHDVFPKLARLKMPVVLTSEWTENNPLAKAEWLKFFGILVGKEALAAVGSTSLGRLLPAAAGIPGLVLHMLAVILLYLLLLTALGAISRKDLFPAKRHRHGAK